ncbi:hypothetical protein AA3250_0896 [Gluconobacter albidus NBRC 3250]|nr:hypothetical protein AA3250_0896 [Gluconobacter albidus NBRC 3250]
MPVIMDDRLVSHMIDLQTWPGSPERTQTNRNPVDPVRPRPDHRNGTDVSIQIRVEKRSGRAGGEAGKADNGRASCHDMPTGKKRHRKTFRLGQGVHEAMSIREAGWKWNSQKTRKA